MFALALGVFPSFGSPHRPPAGWLAPQRYPVPLLDLRSAHPRSLRAPYSLEPTGASSQPEDLRRSASEWLARGDAQLYVDGHPEAALKSVERGLHLARQLGDRSLVSRSLRQLSAVFAFVGENDRALSLAKEARSVARETGKRQDEAWALAQLGDAYWGLARYGDALETFQLALAMMREVGDRVGEATALRNVGITYRFIGQYDQAIQLLHEAVDICRELNDRLNLISALQNLGQAYADLGEYGPTLGAYQQSLEIAREVQNARQSFEALTRIGLLYLELNDYQRALDHFKQALAIVEARKLPLSRVWLLRGMSRALYGLGQVQAAVDTYRQTLRPGPRPGDEMGMASDLWGLGNLYVDRKPVVAAGYFHRSLEIFESHDFALLWMPYASLGRAYRQQGDLDRAVAYYQKAVEHLERVRGRLASDQYKALYLGKRHHLYEDFVDALWEQHLRLPGAHNDVRAFEIAERTKARAMVEAMTDARLDVGRELQPDLRQREQQLNARLSNLQRRLIQLDPRRPERQRLLAELGEAEQAFDRLVAEIRRRNPRDAARRYPEPLSLEQTQALLDGSTALVTYLITPDQVVAFVVTAKAFHAERLGVLPTMVAARVQNYLDLVARASGLGWQDIGRRLYADLVAPLRSHLPREIQRLIIIPDGVLHYVPFEALDHDGRYLLEDFAISYAPSATVLAELQTSRATVAAAERADLLMVADPALPASLRAPNVPQRAADRTRALYDDEGLQVEPIPFSAAEANAIARYARRGTTVYVGADASEHRIKTDPLDRFRVIHFATHGLISERAPARSALVLAFNPGDNEDGFLQAREIYQLKLKSDLVVLSACQTARGRMLAGEGVQGLARAFLHAGAQAVLVSLWNVNDERTAALMVAFYRHLADGQSKADALRSAKLDLLRSGATAAPRYWAPFILIGDADVPVPINGPPWWLRTDQRVVVSVGLALAVLASLVLVRARGR